jgi:integrase
LNGSLRKRGDKWYYSFDLGVVDGKRKRVERVGGRTKKEAEQAMRKAIQEYENSGLHFDQTEITVADYMDFWLDNYARVNCRENTVRNYENIVNKHIKPAMGSYRLRSLTPAVLQKFINDKSLAGFSLNHVKGILAVVTSSMKASVHPYKMLKDNPAQYIKIPRMEASRKEVGEKVISDDNMKKIIERFPPGSTFYVPLMLGYHTGMRIGEVTGLTWDNVDMDAGTISVSRILLNRGPAWCFGPPKTERSVRTIPIGPTLIGILKDHRRRQIENRLKYGRHYTKYGILDDEIVERETGLEFVCTRENGGVVTHNSVKYMSRIINYELGITFNFHALRHTHATVLLENGAKIKDVQARLGHSNTSTTMDTYAHATEKMARDTVEILERSLSTR